VILNSSRVGTRVTVDDSRKLVHNFSNLCLAVAARSLADELGT
jgi:hypothetical protein